MITKPTKITETEYKNSTIAIDEHTGDVWLKTKTGITLWVGRYTEDIEPCQADLTKMVDGDFLAVRDQVEVVGESGEDVMIEAIVYDAENYYGKIDLDYLEEGKIKWM